MAKSPPPAPPRGSPGKRCYAIGDVHGRLDLLTELLDTIARDIRERPGPDCIVVLLGDLIDRGPNSREVVELARKPPAIGARFVVLKGNHEEALVQGLTGAPERLREWLNMGGYECARSYGVEPARLVGLEADALEHVIGSAIPGSHIAFLKDLPDSARFGDYLLVHAGIRPGVPVASQSPRDLRWIRTGFLESAADHGCVVVHGHSISLEIEARPNRIGIDTGAYRSGVLTAVWIEGENRGFIQVKGQPAETT